MPDYENMPKWDGFDSRGEFWHDTEGWDMRKDEEGNIWYLTREEIPQWNLWCGASRLDSYLWDMWRRGFSGFEKRKKEGAK